MSSYFSERTAEYSILPPLVEYLKDRFGNAVPMFFWRTREGNNRSGERHAGAVVRVIAVFARRPKESGQEGVVFGKINAVLHDFAASAVPVGIPCFAGFPAAETLFDLGQSPTFWFAISPDRNRDLAFDVRKKGAQSEPVGADGVPVATVSFEDIGDAVERIARPMAWADAVRTIREIRVEADYADFYSRMRWGSYKPVYLVIPEGAL